MKSSMYSWPSGVSQRFTHSQELTVLLDMCYLDSCRRADDVMMLVSVMTTPHDMFVSSCILF